MDVKFVDNPEMKTNFPKIPMAAVLRYMGYVSGDELRTCPKAHSVIGQAMQRARLGIPAVIWCFATDFRPDCDSVGFEKQILLGINDIISDHLKVEEASVQDNVTIKREPTEIVFNVEVRFSWNVCFEILIVRYEHNPTRESWN